MSMGIPSTILGGPGETIRPDSKDNAESLKKTLQDPNTSMPDTMNALGKLYQMYGGKVADGSASEDEKTQFNLIDALRSGNIPDSDRDQLATHLGMSTERLAEVQKQFQAPEGSAANLKV